MAFLQTQRFLDAYPHPRDEPIEHVLQRARELRAQTLAGLVGSAVRRTAQTARRAARAVARTHRRRTALRQLMTLDERMLKDIGLTRGEIRSAVDGIFSDPQPDVGARQRTVATLPSARHGARTQPPIKTAA